MSPCVACGKPLAASDDFCPACGRVATIDYEPGDRAQPASAPRHLRPTLWLAPLAACSVAVAAIVFVVFASGRIDSASDDGRRAADTSAVTSFDPEDDEPVAIVASDGGRGEFRPLDTERLVDAEVAGEVLVVVDAPSAVRVLDLASGEWSSWAIPEPLVDEDPATVAGWVVVIGETSAWARPTATDFADPWVRLGPADRVRFSTKLDRVWLRSPNEKQHPSDAEYAWNEVGLDGTVFRTMFRNRDLFFATPELVAGIGGDIFRFTDASINAWRLFSPYGVIIAKGPNDLIVKECDSELVCEQVWYETATGNQRSSVYADLAQQLEPAYGAKLSLDGRYVYWEDDDGATKVQSVTTNLSILNDCNWGAPLAWASTSDLFVCTTNAGTELYESARRSSLGFVSEQPVRFVFAPIGETKS